MSLGLGTGSKFIYLWFLLGVLSAVLSRRYTRHTRQWQWLSGVLTAAATVTPVYTIRGVEATDDSAKTRDVQNACSALDPDTGFVYIFGKKHTFGAHTEHPGPQRCYFGMLFLTWSLSLFSFVPAPAGGASTIHGGGLLATSSADRAEFYAEFYPVFMKF
jgi:4-amino-4-deoxy-L-arabinose transferase-like glycosyltransferase